MQECQQNDLSVMLAMSTKTYADNDDDFLCGLECFDCLLDGRLGYLALDLLVCLRWWGDAAEEDVGEGAIHGHTHY